MSDKVKIEQNDYVSFHTKHGKTTGLVEVIFLTRPKVALITVRNMSGKPKKYYRPVYKLKKIV